MRFDLLYTSALTLALTMGSCTAERPRDGSPAAPAATTERTDERAPARGRGMMGDGMMSRDGMMGEMQERMVGDRMMMGDDGDMPEWMMSRGMMMDRTMMRDMHVVHGLLANHDAIEREVELIPGGVRTRTTSEDPEIGTLIRAHVEHMHARIEEGRPIRQMDPLFRELFDHHEAIAMDVRSVPGGVVVTETSDDPRVVALIRQHATEAVSEFVAEGMSRAMRPTPLPEGYDPDAPPEQVAAAGSGR